MTASNRNPADDRTLPMGRLRLVITAAAVLAFLLGPVGSAAAHDTLVGTRPAQDETVDTAPSNVSLEFGHDPQSLGTEVIVTGPDGTSASEGAPEIAGSTVTQQLAGGLPAGTYTVSWRATSADGHPLTGSFGFAVARDAPAVGAAASGGDGDLVAASTESSSFPVVSIVIALIAAAAVVLVVRQLRRPA